MAFQGGDDQENKTRQMASAGFGYPMSGGGEMSSSDQTHLVSHLDSYEQNQEMYGLGSSMDHMIGYQPKTTTLQGFGSGSVRGAPSSSKAAETGFYPHDNNQFSTGGGHETTSDGSHLIVGAGAAAAPQSSSSWQENHHENRSLQLVDETSMRCVFPCEGNERPSQGLSLSLSSTNPSGIGLQSFELRQTTTTNNPNHIHHHHDQHEAGDHHLRFMASAGSRDGPSSNFGQAVMIMQQESGGSLYHLIRSSKYLGPTQELLKEFCNLGASESGDNPAKKSQKNKQWEDDGNGGSSSGGRDSMQMQSLYALDLLELQKRKRRLLAMLDELDRRYKHYCEQMKAVVSSFEAVAGNGAATVYSALASKAMSRHFRSLRDGIVGQIKATKKAMGDKDTVAPGTTKGETPRLRVLDQTLRQQRAFQQMTMMESHPWRPQRGLPERSVSVLRAWLFEHFLHPYPSDVDKHILARQTGLSRSQVSNWFINARVRLWKPMVEEMYLEEAKEEIDKMGSSSNAAQGSDENGRSQPPHLNQQGQEQKPTPDQLLRVDTDCLSSIISNSDKNRDKNGKNTAFNTLLHHQQQQQQGFGRVDSFGPIDMDFSSYNQNTHPAFGAGGGVSLTLGLQQNAGNGVSLAFSSAAHNSLFYGRDPIEDDQPVEYSLLDGDQGPNLPYRNLMGAQLLHDYT
ncbi:Homeobox protein BEL1-like protein [Drosera capensis]